MYANNLGYLLVIRCLLSFYKKISNCSETTLTEVPKVCRCIPWMQTADPLDGKQRVDPLDQLDCVVVWECRSSTGLLPSPPPSNGSGPYRIIAVCQINLCPAVRMELEQEGKQMVDPLDQRDCVVVWECRSSTRWYLRNEMFCQYIFLGIKYQLSI
jgi:hypothetical protein